MLSLPPRGRGLMALACSREREREAGWKRGDGMRDKVKWGGDREALVWSQVLAPLLSFFLFHCSSHLDAPRRRGAERDGGSSRGGCRGARRRGERWAGGEKGRHRE